MTSFSDGFRHYLLILAQSVIEELTDIGLALAAQDERLDDHEVDRAFFTARALRRRLPPHPDKAPDELWPDLMRAVHTMRRVLDVLEGDTFELVAEEARKTTSRIARNDLEKAFEAKKAEGEIDFRLHSLSRTAPKEGEPDAAVEESFRLKRANRFHMLLDMDLQSLKENERAIVADAQQLARDILPQEHKARRLDGLLTMSIVLRETAGVRLNTAIPEIIREKFDRMTQKAAMALGAIVYIEEYQGFKQSLGLKPLASDL